VLRGILSKMKRGDKTEAEGKERDQKASFIVKISKKNGDMEIRASTGFGAEQRNGEEKSGTKEGVSKEGGWERTGLVILLIEKDVRSRPAPEMKELVLARRGGKRKKGTFHGVMLGERKKDVAKERTWC